MCTKIDFYIKDVHTCTYKLEAYMMNPSYVRKYNVLHYKPFYTTTSKQRPAPLSHNLCLMLKNIHQFCSREYYNSPICIIVNHFMCILFTN